LADEVIPLSALSEKLQETIMTTKAKTTVVAPAAATNQGPAQPQAASSTPPAVLETTPPSNEPADDEDEDEEDEETPPKKEAAPVAAPLAVAAPVFNAEVAAEIANICAVAKRPELAAGYIKQGLSVQHAKAALFDSMASVGDVIISGVSPTASTDDEATTLLVAGMRGLNERTQGRRR
jgi:hypothetical protein